MTLPRHEEDIVDHGSFRLFMHSVRSTASKQDGDGLVTVVVGYKAEQATVNATTLTWLPTVARNYVFSCPRPPRAYAHTHG